MSLIEPDDIDGKEPFNFESLYGASHWPNLKILVKVAQEQLDRGEPMEKVLIESLEFASSQAASLHTDLVVHANKRIADGLQDLYYYRSWPNLARAAEHALELEGRILSQDDKLKDITELNALRRKVLKTSISELSGVFKDEWLEENFPTLKRETELMEEEYKLKHE